MFEKKEVQKIEVVKQKEVQKKQVLIGSIKPHENHILFEINPIDKTIKKAIFQTSEIDFVTAKKGLLKGSKKIVVNKNCIYISALNEKNVKKILKRSYGIVFN